MHKCKNLNYFVLVPSPPPSPMSKNADLEVSHVESILEDVCSSKEINKEAVLRLCGHVNAEPQEEQVKHRFCQV